MAGSPGGRWVLVTFDLPVRSKAQVRAATGFRHHLADLGYTALHRGAAERFVPAGIRIDAERNRVLAGAPARGTVVIVEVSLAARRRATHLTDARRRDPGTPPDLLTVY